VTGTRPASAPEAGLVEISTPSSTTGWPGTRVAVMNASVIRLLPASHEPSVIGVTRTLVNVSPRRNHSRRRAGAEPPRALTDERVRKGIEGVQQWQDGEWMVRSIFGGAAAKTYRCPGCMQEIRPGVAHVVAWPIDGRGDETDRRHWHTGCWKARDRRGPGVERSRNAPRYG
jgi:hypothetical protein